MKFLSSLIILTLLLSSNVFAKSKKGSQFTADKLTAKVKTFKTGLDLRDKHTKDKLDSKNHKEIIVSKAVASGGKGSATISIKGIKKNVSFTYKEMGKYIKAMFPLSLKDFKFTGIKHLELGLPISLKIHKLY